MTSASAGDLMIVALEVQEPVHDEVLQVIDERDALLLGLAGDRLGRKPDVAEEADLLIRGRRWRTTARWSEWACRGRPH